MSIDNSSSCFCYKGWQRNWARDSKRSGIKRTWKKYQIVSWGWEQFSREWKLVFQRRWRDMLYKWAEQQEGWGLSPEWRYRIWVGSRLLHFRNEGRSCGYHTDKWIAVIWTIPSNSNGNQSDQFDCYLGMGRADSLKRKETILNFEFPNYPNIGCFKLEKIEVLLTNYWHLLSTGRDSRAILNLL
jgi:hypothetical protein